MSFHNNSNYQSQASSDDSYVAAMQDMCIADTLTDSAMSCAVPGSMTCACNDVQPDNVALYKHKSYYQLMCENDSLRQEVGLLSQQVMQLESTREFDAILQGYAKYHYAGEPSCLANQLLEYLAPDFDPLDNALGVVRPFHAGNMQAQLAYERETHTALHSRLAILKRRKYILLYTDTKYLATQLKLQHGLNNDDDFA